MKPSILSYCKKRASEFDLISDTRKKELLKLSAYLRYKEDESIDLIFLDTNNSIQSIFCQVWAKVAANYYSIEQVETYSAGTTPSEIAGNVIYTFDSLAFDMMVVGDDANPRHYLVFDQKSNVSICQSNSLEHHSLPKKEFGVILTENNTENQFPLFPKEELRLSLVYPNPSYSDGTSRAQQEYRSCSNNIAREMLYTFKNVRKNE